VEEALTYEYDFFISYNHIDEQWAESLARRIERERWQGRPLRVFFAPWDIRPGENFVERIEEALPKSRKLGLIMSPDAANSEWVKLERLVKTYIDVTERAHRLIPLYLRTCEVPLLLKPIVYVDFRDAARFEEGYRKLLAVIKDESLPRGSDPSSPLSASTTLSLPRPPIVGFVARRDKEGRDLVERLKDELAPQKNQLVALWGPGGVGKTTLALEAVRALAGVFAQRLVWTGPEQRVDFNFITLLDEIATQLGHADLRTLALELKKEQVRALLAAAPALIVLDNFETIKAEEQTPCAEWLRRSAPCPALITTRVKIDGAGNIPIAAMSPEEARVYLERLIGQTHDSQAFAGLDRDHIIRTAEANPLVLQWVVAQIDAAQEPRTVLDELAQGEGDAARRVFDRSFDLPQLVGDGQAALLALSLFVPSASRPALAEVAGFGDDVKRLNEAVRRLALLWLVKTSEGNQRLLVEGLTRELAKSRLARHQSAEVFRQRFVAHFLRFARAHAQPTPEDFDALEIEKDNVLRAMDEASRLKSWESVMVIADVLTNPVHGLLGVHGYWDEAIQRGEQALDAARSIQDEESIARFAHNLAITYQDRGEMTEARRLYEQSLEINKKLGNQSVIASSLHQLAMLAQNQGDTAEARRLYEQSLEIEKKLGNQSGIASTLHNLAALAQDQGEIAEARRLYEQSLEIAKKLGDQNGIASTLHQLGRLAQDQGELAEARRLYEQSLEIKKKLGNQGGIASTLHNLAALAQAQGDTAEARRLYEQSLEINRKLGNQSGIASTLHNLAALAEDEGNKTEAERLFREALSIFEKLKSPNAEIARRSLERVKVNPSKPKSKPKSRKRKP